MAIFEVASERKIVKKRGILAAHMYMNVKMCCASHSLEGSLIIASEENCYKY